MKKISLILFCCGVAWSAMAQTGIWAQKNDIGFSAPNGPVAGSATTAFGIGSVGFVAAQAPQASDGSLKNYFGQYDPATNTWSQKAAFPGLGGHIGFTLGGKGYMTSGSSFLQYDPVTDTWAQMANYPAASSTSPSTALSIGSKGYLGGGRFFVGTGYTNVFYEYDPATNAWTRKADLPDPLGQGGRSGDVAFSIGNKGYWGTGSNDQDFAHPTFLNDFWEYDPAIDTWTQKANFGGAVRSGAVGFSIGNMGYIGTGEGALQSDGVTHSFYKDFWQYDPAGDTWTQKADFAGGNRVGAVGFNILGNGYIGAGTAGSCNVCSTVAASDFWQYDPAADTWMSIAGFAAPAMQSAISFGIGGKGYIGLDAIGKSEWWEYDTLGGTWTQKASFPGASRLDMVGFAIGNNGYAGTGDFGGTFFSDFWQFDPVANSWTKKADFGGGARAKAVGFGIDSKGYIGTGTTDLNSPSGYKKDFWEYDPIGDVWTQKKDFGGSPRYGAVGLVLGTKGYVGTGWDTTVAGGRRKDFWQYDPATDLWSQKADFGGGTRISALGFGIDGKGYLGTGLTDGSSFTSSDIWQYDTLADSWTRVADFAGGARTGAAGFAIGHMGYAGTGYDANSIAHNDLWQFDPSGGASLPLSILAFTGVYEEPSTLLHWQTAQEQNTRLFNIQRSKDAKDFAIIGTVPAAGSSTGVTGYSYTDGGAAGAGVPVLYYRLEEMDQDDKPTFSKVVAVNVEGGSKGLILSPNPATDRIMVGVSSIAASGAVLTVADMSGRKMLVQNINLYSGNNSIPLAIGQLPAGIYYLSIEGAAGKWQGKFVKD
jgi:N-acetylneuraminic acid mutarotase